MKSLVSFQKLLFALSTAAAFLYCALSPLSVPAQRLSQVVIPSHYALTLTPDLTAATFVAQEQIDVVVKSPVNAITLNAEEIKFDRVTAIVDGKKLSATVTLDDKKEQATFSFTKQIGAGHITLVVDYSGILNNELRGFYLSKTAKRNYAVTQFEATDARRAFPSFDEPAFKATYDVTLVVNKGDTAISNTNIIADKPGPLAGQHTIQFATTPKMSTYLLAFLVGDFECVSGESDGVPVRACATPGNAAMGKYAVTSAEYFLHYYDQYFGIKYPMPKLDMIALPDFEAGAMENFGAITYRETDLLIDENTASIGQKQRVALVVAHEMAHQWFGDMVTMDWWNNIWLNEGFATWMENKAVASWKPEWHVSQGVAVDLQETMDLDARAKTRTIRAEAETPAQINEMFDGIAYGKAGAVLNMVENYVGEETFRRGVHNYLSAHLYANATAEDFWTAQTAASHKPVDEVMKSLVTEPGVPLLTFSGPQEGRVGVAQQRFFLTPVPAAPAQSWTLPVCVDAGGTATCTVVSGAHPSLALTGPNLYFANAGGRGYYRSKYSAEQYGKLVAAVETSLAPEERISLLGDELALMHANLVPVGDYLDLVAAIREDESDYVVGRGADGAARVRSLIASDDQERAAMARWIDKTFSLVLERLGDPVAGESAQKSQLRVTLLSAVGELGRDPAVIAKARQIAARYLADPQSVDATLAPATIKIAAMSGDAAFFDRLVRTYETSPSPQMRSIALRGLTDFRDPSLEKRALDYAVSGKVRNQDSSGLIGRMLRDEETRDVAWAYLQANWGKVATQMTKWGGGGMVGAAGSFCSVEGRDQVSSFFASHKVEGTERALGRAIDQINDCIALRAAQGPALKEWLARQN